jgi:hypothetical protein
MLLAIMEKKKWGCFPKRDDFPKTVTHCLFNRSKAVESKAAEEAKIYC